MSGVIPTGTVNIAYESTGDITDPAILLIGGAAMQLSDWPAELVEGLVARGYREIAYDARDIGLSTHFDAAGVPDFGAVMTAAATGARSPLPYTLDDMVDDAIGVLDALQVKRANVVGISMGGMVARMLARRHGDRVLSLTSMMASDGRPGLPVIANPTRLAAIPVPGVPSDRTASARRQLAVWHALSGPNASPSDSEIREHIDRSMKRSYCPVCEQRQGAASLYESVHDRRPELGTITAPSVIIHRRPPAFSSVGL